MNSEELTAAAHAAKRIEDLVEGVLDLATDLTLDLCEDPANISKGQAEIAILAGRLKKALAEAAILAFRVESHLDAEAYSAATLEALAA